MNQTRKMWASAAVIGVVVVGGTTVAAAATAGRLEKGQETRAVVDDHQPQQVPPALPETVAPRTEAPQTDPPTIAGQNDDKVVSHEVNEDPQKVIQYWTDKRMENAQPMPMPEVRQGN